jgi:hypothetical protein
VSGRLSAIGNWVPGAVLGGGLLGALLLIVAEFTTLYEVRTDASSGPLKSVGTGPHHAFALVPIALLAAVLAYGASRQRSRPALLAIGTLGLITLLIALIGDLPDAQATGLIRMSSHFVNASSTPETGMYLETLGAALLLLTCGVGVLLGGPPPRPDRRRTRPPRPKSDS